MNDNDSITLKEQLSEFYGGLELSPSVLEDIRQPDRLDRRAFWQVIGIAAAIALMATIGVSFWSGTDVAGLAMAEVAKNHLKGNPPEIESTDYAAVGKHLELPITHPPDWLATGYELIGGRHCKVQGEFAAQLKVRPREGGPAATVYVVPAIGVLANVGAANDQIDGVSVRCERVGAQLFFIAEDGK